MDSTTKEEILDLLYTIGWEVTTPEGLSQLYERLSDELSDDHFNIEFWEDLLGSVEMGKASALGIVGLLRRLHPVSERLSNWDSVIKAAERELNSRDLDGEQILRGL